MIGAGFLYIRFRVQGLGFRVSIYEELSAFWQASRAPKS